MGRSENLTPEDGLLQSGKEERSTEGEKGLRVLRTDMKEL